VTVTALSAARRRVVTVSRRTIVSRADDWWTAWKQFFF